MRILSLLVLLSVSTTIPAAGQGMYDYFNSESYWGKFRFVQNDALRPAAGDTVITVVSNRQYAPGTLRFLGEHRESDTKALRYFTVWSHRGSWQIAQRGSLSEALRFVPQQNRDWVVYTEGMGKIFTSDVDRGMRLTGTYGVNVLLMDYPSIRTDAKSLRNYYFAIGNARAAHRYFTPVFDSVRILKKAGKLGTGHLSLFFHSMGNNVIKKMASGPALAAMNGEKWVDNIVLNAPCVRSRGHRKWLRDIRFANGIAVNYNPEDMTLKWARIISFRKQLGDRLRGPLVPEVLYVNFNTLTGKSHSNFLAFPGRGPMYPEAFTYYNELFHGGRLRDSAPKFRPSVYRGLGFDILPD